MKRPALKTCIACICRFDNLRELTLEFCTIRTTEPIDSYLSLIGQKCTKLWKLDLFISNSVRISHRFFDTFYEFKAIKKLKIKMLTLEREVLKGNVECFKHCKQLSQIDIDYPQLTEHFFLNVATFVPKLQSLRITTQKQFSRSFIRSFHSMKIIQKVILFYTIQRNPLIYKRYWYFGKCLLEVLLSPNGMDVRLITNNCGFISYYSLIK